MCQDPALRPPAGLLGESAGVPGGGGRGAGNGGSWRPDVGGEPGRPSAARTPLRRRQGPPRRVRVGTGAPAPPGPSCPVTQPCDRVSGATGQRPMLSLPWALFVQGGAPQSPFNIFIDFKREEGRERNIDLSHLFVLPLADSCLCSGIRLRCWGPGRTRVRGRRSPLPGCTADGKGWAWLERGRLSEARPSEHYSGLGMCAPGLKLPGNSPSCSRSDCG